MGGCWEEAQAGCPFGRKSYSDNFAVLL
jgi:hypothetical protein